MESGKWRAPHTQTRTERYRTHLEETRPGTLAPGGNIALWIFGGAHDWMIN